MISYGSLRRGAWALALVLAAGTSIAIVLAWTFDAAGPPTGPEEDEETVVLQVAEPVTLPGPQPGDWTVHGRVHGASNVAALDGGWVVLDAQSREAHLLDDSLRLRSTFARQGEGPGELAAPVAVAVAKEGLIGVIDLSGRRLDLFTTAGEPVDRVRPFPDLCTAAGVVRDLLAHPGGGFVVDIDCTGVDGREWTVARVAPDGTSSSMARTALAAPGAGPLELARGVVAWNGRIHAATPDGCLRPLLPADTSSPAAFCLPARDPVPLPPDVREEIEATFPDRPDAPPLKTPRHLPPFLDMRESPVGPVFTIPTHPDSAVLAILKPGGDILTIRGPVGARAGAEGLLLVRSFMEGTGFQLVPWDQVSEFGRLVVGAMKGTNEGQAGPEERLREIDGPRGQGGSR